VPQLRAHATRATTQSGIQQDAMRRNQAEVGEESQQLRASVKDAKRGFTDDTGWRINGESAFMMGSDTDEATVYKSVYVIATRRSASSSHRIRAA